MVCQFLIRGKYSFFRLCVAVCAAVVAVFLFHANDLLHDLAEKQAYISKN